MTDTTVQPDIGTATNAAKWKARRSTRNAPPAGGGAVYGLGMIGALVYFFQRAETMSDYGLALLKAAVWPALLVYAAFKRLG